jgi:hypothetical protein
MALGLERAQRNEGGEQQGREVENRSWPERVGLCELPMRSRPNGNQAKESVHGRGGETSEFAHNRPSDEG